MVKRERLLEYSVDADIDLQFFKAYEQAIIDGKIRTHLIENDPYRLSKNNGPLDTPDPLGDRRLKIPPWRVFYLIEEEQTATKVKILRIGHKPKETLYIRGKKVMST